MNLKVVLGLSLGVAVLSRGEISQNLSENGTGKSQNSVEISSSAKIPNQNSNQSVVYKANQNSSQIEIWDPLEGYNRFMTGFNDIVYDYVFYPVAFSYDYVMPDPVQGAVYNFFDNLLYPLRLINNLLQGNLDGSWNETKRFFVNTTIGFAGFSDAATLHFDIPRSDEDFGQTLGVWGVPAGPHIVLPIIGSSNLRDTFGLVGDYFSDPVSYIDDDATRVGVQVGRGLNEFSINPRAYKDMKKDKDDLYIFMRDSYEQKRAYDIKN